MGDPISAKVDAVLADLTGKGQIFIVGQKRMNTILAESFDIIGFHFHPAISGDDILKTDHER
jgi:hypothetical protein